MKLQLWVGTGELSAALMNQLYIMLAAATTSQVSQKALSALLLMLRHVLRLACMSLQKRWETSKERVNKLLQVQKVSEEKTDSVFLSH